MTYATKPDGSPALVPDAYGQAAMLLIESLIHNLIERAVISAEDAIGIVTTAVEVKREVADSWGDTAEVLAKSLTLLDAIRMSLERDLG